MKSSDVQKTPCHLVKCISSAVVFNTTQFSSNLLFRLLFHVELSHCMINIFSITFLFRSKHMIVPCGQSIPHSIMVNYRFKCDLRFLLITIVNSSRLWYSLSNIYKEHFLILQTKLHLNLMADGRTFITMPNYHFNFPRRNFVSLSSSRFFMMMFIPDSLQP